MPKEKLTAEILKNGNIYDLCEFASCSINPPMEETINAVIEKATNASQVLGFINILLNNFSIKYDDKAINAKSELFKAFVSFGDVKLIDNVLNGINYGERDGDLMFEGFVELFSNEKIDKEILKRWMGQLRKTSYDSFMPFINLKDKADVGFMICRMHKLSQENQAEVCEAFINMFQIEIMPLENNQDYYRQIMNNYFYGSSQYFKPFLEYVLMKQGVVTESNIPTL